MNLWCDCQCLKSAMIDHNDYHNFFALSCAEYSSNENQMLDHNRLTEAHECLLNTAESNHGLIRQFKFHYDLKEPQVR